MSRARIGTPVAWQLGVLSEISVGGDDVALVGAERHTGRMASTGGLERPRLLRRLTIICPVTGLATDTGFELSDIPALVSGPQLLIVCLECGQDHPVAHRRCRGRPLTPPPRYDDGSPAE
jgi:hypothetical protein